MDAKDILGIPKNFPSSQERRPTPRKETQRKPDGVSREVYALTGGMAPLMPAVEASHLKRRPPPNAEKITWQWLSFTSSARSDNLHLYHWVRVVNGVPPTGDYSFAKYNKSVDVLKYTDEEYEKHLTDPTWTKEETDQLFDLCERFDLRFIVIADRFPTSRSVEELKNRYYAVSRALLLARAPSSSDVSGHPLVKESYNMGHEIERKRALSTVFSQSKQQERRDAEILAESKRIMESRMASKSIEEVELPINASGAESIDRTSTPAESVSPSSNIQPPSSSTAPLASAIEIPSTPVSLRMLRVYLRSHALDQMVQTMNTTAGLRTSKRVDQTLQDLGVHLKPKVPTKSVCGEHLELRKEIITLLNLQKQLQNRDVEASANRDNSYTETPGTPKRNYRGDIDRTFIPESVGYGGERVGKRDHKRKAPGRFIDGPPSPPQSKRPRKMKASD
ncbi:putative SWR1-complex protein 4 [Iris pallida]|uniref:SWR1-complex protein 4 n=1 Tax=Iris pallida TaxID=29817 RepID=A0AAX6FHV5_IRIPA|nr:putative SWR1-complex protein 4 [Iris pallida]